MLFDTVLKIQRWYRRARVIKKVKRRLRLLGMFRTKLLAVYKGWKLRKRVMASP